MVSRRKLKEEHENSVLASFCEYMKSKGNLLNIKSQPDPPDAFVEISGKDTWIEITDAFYSQDVAISITSYAADDATHRPSRRRLVGDADSTTMNEVKAVILKKLAKPSMISIANSNGTGTLLVGLFGPFFDLDEVAENISVSLKSVLSKQQIFDSVFLYESCDVNVHRYKKVLW